MTIFSRAFWKYAGERAIKTFAQALLGALTGTSVVGVESIGWMAALSIAAVAALVSVLTSITAYTGPTAEPEQPAVQNVYHAEHAAPDSGATAVFPQIRDDAPHEPASL